MTADKPGCLDVARQSSLLMPEGDGVGSLRKPPVKVRPGTLRVQQEIAFPYSFKYAAAHLHVLRRDQGLGRQPTCWPQGRFATRWTMRVPQATAQSYHLIKSYAMTKWRLTFSNRLSSASRTIALSLPRQQMRTRQLDDRLPLSSKVTA